MLPSCTRSVFLILFLGLKPFQFHFYWHSKIFNIHYTSSHNIPYINTKTVKTMYCNSLSVNNATMDVYYILFWSLTQLCTSSNSLCINSLISSDTLTDTPNKAAHPLDWWVKFWLCCYTTERCIIPSEFHLSPVDTVW